MQEIETINSQLYFFVHQTKHTVQFAGTDDEGSLDDFFAPEPIADIATPSVDDYFTDTE